MKIKFERTDSKAYIPQKAHESDSGFDLRIPYSIVLEPYELKLVDMGVAFEIPEGWEGQVRGRSGIATKDRVIIPIGVGTIDSHYRGNIKVPFLNLNTDRLFYTRGHKMAQIIFKEVEKIELVEDNINKDTDRGIGGFGSTG
jgi:dUTP pyrophosphatase